MKPELKEGCANSEDRVSLVHFSAYGYSSNELRAAQSIGLHFLSGHLWQPTCMR
jgi:hypothetical protein